MIWRYGLTAGVLSLTMLTTDMCVGFTVGDLRCEYRSAPLGIDVVQPRLSWRITSERRGERQTAYQVLVSSTAEALADNQGDLWNSGKVDTDRSIQVAYAGAQLHSRMRCHWKVRAWNRDGKPSAWSAPAFWSMGLLEPGDWQAEWIGYDAAYDPASEAATEIARFNIRGLKWVRYPAKQAGADARTVCLRKRVAIPADRRIRRAVLALYAFNTCEAYVNGTTAGEAVHWDHTARLDVTAALRPGTNVVALTARHTDPYAPAAIGRLVVQFDSGEDLLVPIDDSWKAAKRVVTGWEQPDFDDQAWVPAERFDGQPWRGPPPVADLARMPAPYLRTRFSVTGAVRRATVYVTALGVYDLHLNGKGVGRDVLAPGWTEFRKRVHYRAYDVTALVDQGDNAMGAILGDGWYASTLAHLARRNVYGGRPRLLAQLEIELADGTVQTVTSNGGWQAAYGPIRHADLLMGCEYDARMAMPGWDTAVFDARNWQPVVASTSTARAGVADVTSHLQRAVKDGRLTLQVENDVLGGDPAQGVVKTLRVVYRQNGREATRTLPEHDVLDLGTPDLPVNIVRAEYGTASAEEAIRVQAAVGEPSRCIEELPAIAVNEPRPGCWTFDLGQNMVGWVRLKVAGQAGQRITVRHGEMLNADGTIYTANLRSCPAADFYILSGQGEEVHEPYFTFHGFRYVEVRGISAKPALDTVTGVVVHSDMRRTGWFECSHPLLNRLYSNIVWGQKGNYLEVPTDCPQRDERMGWTGDTQFFAPTAAYSFNVAPFFTRWLTTCEDNQMANGSFPHVVPDIMGGGGATAWGDAALLCTYNTYRVYGDTRIVAERFGAMERYMRWLDGKTSDGISKVGGFGDWLNAGGGAKAEVIDTAYHAHLARIMSEMARAIGLDEAALRYSELHDEVKGAFVSTFLQADGTLKDCSQTGYALAFSMDLLPENMRNKAAARFVGEVERFDWHLATGFIGTPRLLPALNAAGHDDVAYRLLLQDTYPSWLFPVKNGATTMWERWNGWTPEQGFGDISMNSYNHYAFGAVGEYLYGGVGGITSDGPGYRTIRIRPVVREGVTWAKTSFDCMYGRITTRWTCEGSGLVLDVTIPVNTTATVHVPTADAQSVMESGAAAMAAENVKFLRMELGAAVYAVGSGSYRFSVIER